jgi:hypothetical protein
MITSMWREVWMMTKKKTMKKAMKTRKKRKSIKHRAMKTLWEQTIKIRWAIAQKKSSINMLMRINTPKDRIINHKASVNRPTPKILNLRKINKIKITLKEVIQRRTNNTLNLPPIKHMGRNMNKTIVETKTKSRTKASNSLLNNKPFLNSSLNNSNNLTLTRSLINNSNNKTIKPVAIKITSPNKTRACHSRLILDNLLKSFLSNRINNITTLRLIFSNRYKAYLRLVT